MTQDMEKFLRDILNAPSPSGYEQPAAKIWRNRVKDHADQMIQDVHGNSIAILNPKASFKVMLAGHIDEIGLMITYIDDKGFLYVAQVGGMDPSLLIGQRVRIVTAKGIIPGVIGRKAIHLMTPEERNKAVTMDNIWVDIGAKDKKAAERIVAVGDPMVVDVAFQKINDDIFVARGCDDKAGAFVVAEVIRALSHRKLNVCLAGVATVQEEIGLRGATTSAYTVKPDVGIAIDVGFCTDHPDSDPKKVGKVDLGKGPILHRGPNINPVLEKDLFRVAKASKIPYQVTAEPRATGTDANAIQLSRGGAATALLSLPNRYMHSPVEMLSLQDLNHTIKLLVNLIAKMPAQKSYRP